MPFEPPEVFNIVDWFLDARVREGRGVKIGAVVVMVNPRLPDDATEYFVRYTRARAALAA